jgi:hypothetical protein
MALAILWINAEVAELLYGCRRGSTDESECHEA